jgi:hypothetical protein
MLRGCQLSHAYRQLLLSVQIDCPNPSLSRESLRSSCHVVFVSFFVSLLVSVFVSWIVLVSSSNLPNALPQPPCTCHALPAAACARHGALKTQTQIDLPKIRLDGLMNSGNVEILHDGVDGEVPVGGRGLQGSLLFAQLRIHRLEAVDGLLDTRIGSVGITEMDTHAYLRLVLGQVDVPLQEQRLDLLRTGLRCQQSPIKPVSLRLTL